MKQKNQKFKKQFILLSLLMIVIAPFSAVAQQLNNEGSLCMPVVGTYDLKGQKLNAIVTNIGNQNPFGSNVTVALLSSSITYQVIGTGVTVNPTTGAVSSTTTEKGTVIFHISYSKKFTFPPSSGNGDNNLGVPPECLIYIGGGTTNEITIGGTYSGMFEFHKELPNEKPVITSSRCFTDTVSLRTNSDFQHFDCKWEVVGGSGLTATSPTDEWAVSYERTGTDNQFTIKFTVTDSKCTKTSQYETIVIGTRTPQPILSIQDMCKPIDENTVDVSVTNVSNNFVYLWDYRTNNVGGFSASPTTGTSTTYNIGTASGHIVLKAVGICDTAIVEVRINRSMSSTTSQLWVNGSPDISCVFVGDTLEFSVNPTLQEKIEWELPLNWSIVSHLDSNSGTIKLKVGDAGEVKAKSQACPSNPLVKQISPNSQNVTVGISGDNCLTSGTPFTFNSTIQGATNVTYNWTGLGLTSQNDDFTGIVPNLSGTQLIKLTIANCGREFSDSMEVNFRPALPTGFAYTNVDGKSCVNVGMTDEITFNLTSVDGANTIVWNISHNGTTIPHTPVAGSGGLSVKISVDNLAFDSKLVVEVWGVNNCKEGDTLTEIVTVQGAGSDFRLLPVPAGANETAIIFVQGTLPSPGPAVLLPSISHIDWLLNGAPLPAFSTMSFSSYPANSISLSATLIPLTTSNVCKTKLQR